MLEGAELSLAPLLFPCPCDDVLAIDKMVGQCPAKVIEWRSSLSAKVLKAEVRCSTRRHWSHCAVPLFILPAHLSQLLWLQQWQKCTDVFAAMAFPDVADMALVRARHDHQLTLLLCSTAL